MKGVPAFFDQLTTEDKQKYEHLRCNIQEAFNTAPRSSRLCEYFDVVVNHLKSYVVCGDRQAELRRALVCGIMWIDNVVALNTRQLAITIGKCKSSINSGFTTLGYVTIPPDAHTVTEITKAFPFMRSNFTQMRQWTVRLLPPLDRPYQMCTKEDFVDRLCTALPELDVPMLSFDLNAETF